MQEKEKKQLCKRDWPKNNKKMKIILLKIKKDS